MFGTLPNHPLSPHIISSYSDQMPSLEQFTLGSSLESFYPNSSTDFSSPMKRSAEKAFNRPKKKTRMTKDHSRGLNNDMIKIPASSVSISSVQDQDVLSGRGGATNIHPGNRYFRALINEHRLTYLKAKKNDKPAISRAIVNKVRTRNGRFLKKCEDTGSWLEIGDDLAREKTSQALRQKAPQIRKILAASEERTKYCEMRYSPSSVLDTSMVPSSQENMYLKRRQLLLQMLLHNQQALNRAGDHRNIMTQI